MRIAVTGARGQLGGELCRQLADQAIPLARPDFELTDHAAVRRYLDRLRPDVVINTAAYTAVDQAEDEPQRCWQTNAEAVRNMAEVCAALGSKLVQISTDYVFGGDRTRRRPYGEMDQTAPQSIYAKSKWAGEQFAAQCPRHLIVRTCGLYGSSGHGRNFVETIRRLARQRDALRVVDDQHCTPSSARDMSEAVCFLIASEQSGVFHVVNRGATTWYHFAEAVVRHLGARVRLEPITTEQFGARAPRPAYSVLDTSKYERLQGPTLSHWEQALTEFIGTRLRVGT